MKRLAALLLCATSLASAQESEATEPPPPTEDVGEAAADPEDSDGAPADDDWDLPDDLDDDEFDFDFSAADAAAEEEDSGPEVTFSATSTTVAQYRVDNFNSRDYDDDYASIWERLELNVQVDELRINSRLDAFVPFLHSDCPEAIDPNECLQYDVRLERLSAHWETGDLKLDAGDAYGVLGRGIALSMRRVDVIGVDTALRGGQLAYDSGGVFLKLLGGAANPQNLDPARLTIRRDPVDRLRSDFRIREHDFVIGGEAGVRLGRQRVELGLHALRTWFAFNPVAQRNTIVDVGGWHLALPSLANGKLSFYGEVNALHRLSNFETRADTRTYGRAIYASLQAQLGKGTLLIEWKDYSNYLVGEVNGTEQSWRVYSAAPTLERDQERPRSLFNARGGRMQLDYGFLPGPWSFSATALVYGHAEDVDVDPWSGTLVTHGFAKVQRINNADSADEIGWTFDLEVGARRESYIDASHAALPDLQNGQLDWRVLHFSLEAGIVVRKHSLELSVIHRSERQRFLDFVDFVRSTASLTWSFAGKIRVGAFLGWNTENRSNPALYPGGEARYDFLEGSFIRIFGGMTPGGRICSGGVCRDVPPFSGALTELVIRL